MPGPLLGTYDETAARCAERMTMSRLVVSPDTLEFYYGYAAVDSVVARDDGYDVIATLYQLEGAIEVVPEPVTYRIEPTDGGLLFDAVSGSPPPSPLVRCGERAGNGPANGPDGARSVYTELDLDACETLRTYQESGGVELRCPGYRGVPLYVSEGDLRYDVDAGTPNDEWETPGPFNSLGGTVEWRLRDGRPFAVIVRYDLSGPGGTEQGGRSDLAVITVGRKGAPGCLVGFVAADAKPGQNAAARALADRRAADFDCETARS